MSYVLTKDTLIGNLMDARARTLELVHGLDDQQLMGPRLETVNPLLWEIGHLAWFHEFLSSGASKDVRRYLRAQIHCMTR